jgi:hypothetical protein
MADKPKLDEFLKDPKFQGDRELIEGVISNFLEKKSKEAEEKKKKEELENPPSIFDKLFGGN